MGPMLAPMNLVIRDNAEKFACQDSFVICVIFFFCPQVAFGQDLCSVSDESSRFPRSLLSILEAMSLELRDPLLRVGTALIASFMGPTWGRQDPGGPHVGPMNFAIWAIWTQWGRLRPYRWLNANKTALRLRASYVSFALSHQYDAIALRQHWFE